MALAPGLHPITLGYFEAAAGEALSVSYDGPGIDKQPVPESVLFSDQ